MPVRVSCFGGRIGWWFKKRFPNLAANAYIKGSFILRKKETQNYIDWFMKQEVTPKPFIVNIETINRCNGTCAFCPANRHDDKRPFAQMSEELFEKIIADLKKWDYKGFVSLYVNNEPFIDNRIIKFHKYVKEQLPNCRIKLFTNGSLMTKEKFIEIIPFVDYIVINSYGETRDLQENTKQIYKYVKDNPSLFAEKKIKINIRYVKDVLTNRAGEAPNKKATSKVFGEPCLFPFTDLTIFSNGNVGICCNDATEKSCLGNVMEKSLESIWGEENDKGASYSLIRRKIASGRSGYNFCKNCDTLDTGLRVKISSDKRKNRRE